MKLCFEIFWRFLLLGLISFGGPAAHIGYFQKTFVERLKWLDNTTFAQLTALGQFLPGPGSSQLGFAIGLHRGGMVGAIAAFIGFTLPSFLLMVALSYFESHWQQHQWLLGITHGLKLLAVIVVADACLNMGKAFCSDTAGKLIAAVTAAVMLLIPGITTQMLVLATAAVIGMFIFNNTQGQSTTEGSTRWLPLILFAALFLLLPFVADRSAGMALFNDFYQAGSLVFGGGHVVLPLLQQSVGDAMPADSFLLGYAAAQAVPGPMFSLATFLGAEMTPAAPWSGALLATLAIFLPGFLLVAGLHHSWQALAARPKVAAAVQGINAAVVGLLLSALYQPVFISAVFKPVDMAVVVVGFALLRFVKLPIIWLVLLMAIASAITTVSG